MLVYFHIIITLILGIVSYQLSISFLLQHSVLRFKLAPGFMYLVIIQMSMQSIISSDQIHETGEAQLEKER